MLSGSGSKDGIDSDSRDEVSGSNSTLTWGTMQCQTIVYCCLPSSGHDELLVVQPNPAGSRGGTQTSSPATSHVHPHRQRLSDASGYPRGTSAAWSRGQERKWLRSGAGCSYQRRRHLDWEVRPQKERLGGWILKHRLLCSGGDCQNHAAYNFHCFRLCRRHYLAFQFF